ncbi:hypothetical protein HanPI659440_Chr17g0681211 [Helianthus annuus]|nr:hypothetical protein HanPI659440_Chr17g0681211 [Helianthus annuus]
MGWRNLMFRVAHKVLVKMLEQENVTKLIGIKNYWAAVFKKSYKITGTACEVEPYMLGKLLKHTTFNV